MNVIECSGLIKSYKKTKAIDELSFSIEENKIVGLVGRNGAGKTTLMKILAGFLKESSGNVRVFSRRPFNNITVSANSILIDDQMSFLPALTIGEILTEAGSFYRNWDNELALRLFRHFDFQPGQDHSSLSKGRKSTFNIIIGICSRCPLTIFDEPTTGMDAVTRKDFHRALLKDYLDFPRTIILSSHHLEEMEYLLEEVLLLDAGKKVLQLPIADLNEFAVILRGNPDDINPSLENREVIYKELVDRKNMYAIVKNDFLPEKLKKMKQEKIEIAPVSAAELCIYITKNTGGNIDDVFSRS